MKRITVLFFIMVFMLCSTAHALSWAYPFVVWKGKVYEVKQEELISEKDIGKIIGEVETIPDSMSGRYHGNASNIYSIGTPYYKIKGVSTSKVIAVQENDHWVTAVFVHNTPYYSSYFFTSVPFISILAMFIVIAVVIIVLFSKTKK